MRIFVFYACLLVLLNLFSTNCRSQTLYFPPTSSTFWDTLSPASLNWCENKIDSLYDYLSIQNTKAFILLKDGKIVLEKYFDTHTANSAWYWASAGKTLTAFMIGLAQQDNYLSISDTTSKYLGNGWTACTPEQEQKITIRHQLTMTSGLDDKVPDYQCTLDTCLIFKADAGTRWSYHNGPYTLLDQVIQQATGMTLNNYTTQKLKSVTGMTGSFFPLGYNNVFLSNARSMARFGLLVLNKGNWNGTQIMTDQEYFNQMTQTTQNINQAYGYLWWLNGKSSYMVPQTQIVFPGKLNPNAPDDMIAALGKNGQFINVAPSLNMVWIRMGDAPEDQDVPFLLNDKIWEYLNALDCNTTSSETIKYDETTIGIFPNPVEDKALITSRELMRSIEIFNLAGENILSRVVNSHQSEINMEGIPDGVFILWVTLISGETISKKIVIN